MTFEQLQKEMIAAMKAKNKPRKDAISALVSAVLKEMKTVKEQIDSCPAERTDLLEEYRTRYDVVSEFAPQLMSAEEVESYIKEKFADVVATRNMGQIMKAVMGDLKGKADGKVINQTVKKLCQ